MGDNVGDEVADVVMVDDRIDEFDPVPDEVLE